MNNYIKFKILHTEDNFLYCKIKFKDLLNSLKFKNFEVFKFINIIIPYKIYYKNIDTYTNITKYNPINIEYSNELLSYNIEWYAATFDNNIAPLCINEMLILNNFEYIFNIWTLYNLQIQYYNYGNIDHLSKLKKIKDSDTYILNNSLPININEKLKNNKSLLSETLLDDNLYFIVHHKNKIDNLFHNTYKINNNFNKKSIIINIVYTLYHYHKLYYEDLKIFEPDLNIFKSMFDCYTSFIFNDDIININNQFYDIEQIDNSLFTYDTYKILLNNLLNNKDKIKYYFMLYDIKSTLFDMLIYKAIYAALKYNLKTSKNTLNNICEKLNDLFNSENIEMMQNLLNIKNEYLLNFVNKYTFIENNKIINTEICTRFYNVIKNNIIKYLEYNIKEITWHINI